MDRQHELRVIRAAYAKQILAAAGVVDNVRLEAALSAIRREDFLGAGPWWILRRFQDYVTTPDADPVYLYTDDLVGILPERSINNGQPSLHAHLIHQASPGAGEHVVHIWIRIVSSDTSPRRARYFIRFHTSSAVPPTDASGLVYFNSSAVSDVIIRL